jgi:hypothetical protein
MERGFCVIPNVVAFYPQIKSTRLNEVLGVFWNPGAMYYVHINRLDYKVNEKCFMTEQQMTRELILVGLIVRLTKFIP